MRKQLMDDHQLVKDYVSGNQASFEILLNRHRAKVYSYILLMVKDQTAAEDIFQDTFIKVIKTLQGGKYTEEGKFLPWVMRISHNLIIDHFRRNKRMPSFQTEDDDFNIFDVIRIPEQNIEDKLIKEQLHTDVKKLIEMLPKEQKEVLYMRHYAEMSFNEIAEQTNVSINTALGRMRYALINLRKMIRQHNLNLVE